MSEVVVTEFMDEAAVADLASDFGVLYDPTLVDRRAELMQAVADSRALVVRNRTLVDRDLLAAAPRLRVVGRLGVGLDNIDIEACTERGVEVRPATGANSIAVAEYVITAVLVLVRGAYGGRERMEAGTWPRQALVGGEVSGRRLGLVGFGTIARAVASRAAALGMTVVATDPHIPAADPVWGPVLPVGLDRLLETSDAVSLHVPLGPDTHHLIDAPAIDRMPDRAVLVNTARGGVVDENAVVEALRSGRLGGAALDVFETEPLDADAGSRFASVPNLVLTPHIAGVTLESNRAVSSVTAANVRSVLMSS